MDLEVIGCHGGESPRHRTSAFLVDGTLAIDAGSLTSVLELEAQYRLRAVLVSHAHLDHIRDLATIADNRAQQGCAPLVVAGIKPTLQILRKHFFNGRLWPDFSAIPNASSPTIRYLALEPEVATPVAGYRVRAIPVSHTIETCAFFVQGERGESLAYSGDTGPTDRLWQVVDATPGLKAMLVEVSFPDAEQHVATLSGHHTPRTLARDLAKCAAGGRLPFLLYHMKPRYQAVVERECARLGKVDLTVCKLGDRFVL